MYDINFLKQILQDMGVNPHRLRGQNFLIDESIIKHILESAAVSQEDVVFEIGPGLGALSQTLGKRNGRTVLFEIEPAFAARLRDVFAFEPQVQVMETDATSFDYASFCQEKQISEYHLVANLPYNITTPMIQHLFLQGGPWKQATLMLQKEAAQRICAGKGRENGPLTLMTEYYTEAELLFLVPPESFYPPPAVQSAVMQLRRRQAPPVEAGPEALFPLIQAAFSQRRKQLANTLVATYQRQDGRRFSRDEVISALDACDLAPSIRGEQMSLAQFSALLKQLQRM